MRPEHLSRAVRSAIGQPDFEAKVLEIARSACHTERALLMLHQATDDHGAIGLVLHAPHMSHAMKAEYASHWAHQNPYPDLVRHFPDGRVFTTDEVMSVRDYRKHAYHGWAELTFGTYELGGVIGREAGNQFAIAVGRSQKLGAFTRPQRSAMQSLMDALRPAWFLHRRLAGADGIDGHGVRALVDLALRDHACFAIAGDATMIGCNQLADEALLGNAFVELAQGRVRLLSPLANARFHAILAGRANEGAFSLGDEAQAPVLATLVQLDGGRGRTGANARWLLFVPASAAVRARLRVSSFAERHGLSRRERSVLALLVAGHATDEIASALGLPVDACRQAIKQLMRKSGLSRQAEVVARVLE